MDNDRRKEECPQCHFGILARIGERIIFCLSPSCYWAIQGRRTSDRERLTLPEIKKVWE